MVDLERETAAKRIALQGAEFKPISDLISGKLSFDDQDSSRVTEMNRNRMVFL